MSFHVAGDGLFLKGEFPHLTRFHVVLEEDVDVTEVPANKAEREHFMTFSLGNRRCLRAFPAHPHPLYKINHDKTDENIIVDFSPLPFCNECDKRMWLVQIQTTQPMSGLTELKYNYVKHVKHNKKNQVSSTSVSNG